MSREIIIPLAPITKKNSARIVKRKDGTPFIIPSVKYKQYEKKCGLYMPSNLNVNTPVNVQCIFYMPTRRRVDLVNLLEAALDVLVHYGILDDDNSNIVQRMDGSRVDYDKENPRTEIYITGLTGVII